MEYDIFDKIFYCIEIILAGAGALFIIVLIYMGISFLYDEYIWYKTPVTEVHATLAGSYYEPSRSGSTTGMAVALGSGGKSYVVPNYSYHYMDQVNNTLWRIEGFGLVSCNDKEVFRYSIPEAVLLVKIRGKEIRIVGIKHE